ncbi:uncharacterized protein LOC125560607 [Nematostella vectensis]|uniref:uncharacterized protein LOC125560607 n=1 Tax=Nematostella vectensis TaxID=45351 RepID=UPI002077024C|nr:uncharacterized protein LOC125560607 [Nematostella vectensis]
MDKKFLVSFKLSLILIGVNSQQCDTDGGDFRREDKFTATKGFAISTSIFKSVKVAHAFECSAACLSDSRCRSANYYHKSTESLSLCELSREAVNGSSSDALVQNANSTYYKRTPWDHLCERCKNDARCVISSDRYQGYRCECKSGFSGEHCEISSHLRSCKDIFERSSMRKDKAYSITVGSKVTEVFCQMSSICGSGGWTLVMKADGSKSTFRYDSPLWSNKLEYNPEAGLTGLDHRETKLSTYWEAPFKDICIGMEVADDLRWLNLHYPSESLYDVIADGTFKDLSMSKADWLGLIAGSELQRNCGRNGFNNNRVRIGIMGNGENHCNSPDSELGFGAKQNGYWVGNTCQFCNKRFTSFGYIFVK